jgi:hypothetical protein
MPKRAGTLHLDSRAADLARFEDLDDDQLIKTPLLAGWLDVSEQWCELKRYTGGGPPHVQISQRCVRYRVGDVKEWLRERHRLSTGADPCQNLDQGRLAKESAPNEQRPRPRLIRKLQAREHHRLDWE